MAIDSVQGDPGAPDEHAFGLREATPAAAALCQRIARVEKGNRHLAGLAMTEQEWARRYAEANS